MLHIITELSKYVLVLLFIIYTWFSFSVLGVKSEARRNRLFKNQTSCMLLIHLDAFVVLFAVTEEVKYLFFYGAQLLYLLVVYIIYRLIYKKAERLVVNHMCMLLLIGFIVLARLDFDEAIRQFEIAALATVISAFVPALVRKMKALRRFTWFYGMAGVLALLVVLVLGQATGGANLSFTIGSITFQPSEFVKLLFVFYVACMLYESTSFRQVCVTTGMAALHVIILVLSTDLGAALIFFATYVIMLFVATGNLLYFAGGIGAGGLAGVAAAKLFSHVQVRIEAWKDPFANISGSGWQVAQALFAIGTGGWFGLGLFQGLPESIPVADSDFIFAVIAEELGVVFGICLILVCFSCFVMFLNIAMQIKDMFFKLIALGFGSMYGVQVFLNIGGVIKFIPSTGVTLPLVSYGGSSLLCTIIMFAVIQGLYIARQDEGALNEKEKMEAKPDSRSQQESTAKQAGTGRSGDHRSGGTDRQEKNKRRKRTEGDYTDPW